MKAVIQRVLKASIIIEQEIKREINAGLVVLLGVMEGDTEKHAEVLAKKIAELRIFCDENDKMNLSANDLNFDMLIVSNFTLGADCSHGRRPYFSQSAKPEIAKGLYEYFVEQVKMQNINSVMTGEFGASMEVTIVNDGPVTIILDTDDLKVN